MTQKTIKNLLKGQKYFMDAITIALGFMQWLGTKIHLRKPTKSQI